MEFTDDSHLHLVLENTIIAQTRSHEIVEFLEKIVCERCGMNLIVDLDFEEPKESRYKKNSDLQIQFEIKNILKNINLKDEDGETVAVASDANEKSAASGQTTTSGDSGSTGGGNAVKPAKNDAKSANGAGNTRKEISKEVLNIPVFAVGVPTVVDTVTIVNDTLKYLENYICYMKNNMDNPKEKLKIVRTNIDKNNLENDEKNNLFGLIGTLKMNRKRKIKGLL